tara:strand:- start:10 stop:324 length:315 start_codon:yes stop_codon:yes gene_type:complete
MKAQYRYDHMLGDKEKNLISILLNKGKTIEYISNRFGLSKKFIRTNLCNPDRVHSICLGSKKIAYNDDEMQYGKLELNYSFNELNDNEIEAYNNYELKTKSNNE